MAPIPIPPTGPAGPAVTIAQLPLFPLQSVLFPDGLLPLQIFEIRYLDMIARRHQAGAPFGVVCLSEGSEVRRPSRAPATPTGEAFAHEAFHPVGTLARIDDFWRPQPGLVRVQCTGTRRFRVSGAAQQRYGLWVADVELLPDDTPVAVPDDLAFVRDALEGLLRKIEASLDLSAESGRPTEAELPLRKPYRWDDCGWLANRWCEMLPLDAVRKQRFMQIDSPLLRLELVADALQQIGIGSTG